MQDIYVRGARQHNLKNIDVTIPRLKLTVITGVSGSGKSSLAFDTLFAEGHRRYVEALSADARLFLQKLDAPLVEEIVGLSPAIAIEQKGLPRNPRSTVGTLTEIHDHLRLLFSRLGTVYCPVCLLPVRAWTVQQITAEIIGSKPPGTRIFLIAPLGPIKPTNLVKTLRKLRGEGFSRIRVGETIHELDPPPLLPRNIPLEIGVVVDRLVVTELIRGRLAESIELALRIGKGVITVAGPGEGERNFSESFRCMSCGRELEEPTPGLFSFQNAEGACPKCAGLGFVESKQMPAAAFRKRRMGSGAEIVPDQDEDFPSGVQDVCPECAGARLNSSARAVVLGGRGIHEVSSTPITLMKDWLSSLELTPTEAQIAERPIREIVRRVECMERLGLSYLSLDRAAHTLSGGEAQRVRLSQQVASPLSGILYVLDEPSVGLHPRDHQRLLETLFSLRLAGNTVVVVEHDRDTILSADYVIDMGPGAGELGGRVIFAGTPAQILGSPDSLTGQYLSGRNTVGIPRRREAFSRGTVTVRGAKGHNLRDLTVSFPLECFTCVTGVSGAGKSTLVLDTLYRSLSAKLYGATAKPQPCRSIETTSPIRKVVLINQSPLGRTPRSIPATYTGVFALIRQLFARLPEAKTRGYGAGRFSFNAKGGRCEVCKGDGVQRVEMLFLPDVFITCPVCEGKRYNEETLTVKFKGRSIADVLQMAVTDAAGLFENIPGISQKLGTMIEVGLGYLRLGQSATTLSGGEAQRVKLSAELSRKAAGETLFFLDEPTTGLHFEDIRKLLHVLQRLVDAGNTVIVIEHNPDVILAADYVIDLGPEGGSEGGRVLAKGTPEQVARSTRSYTGKYLKELLRGRKGEGPAR